MSTLAPDSLCWCDGQLLKRSEVVIGLDDRGLTLGDGLFETMLWAQGKIRFFEDHMARLSHSADMLDIDIPASVGAIESGILALAEATGLSRAAIRLTLSRGSGPRGLALPPVMAPRLFATLTPVAESFEPVSAHVVDVRRAAGAPSAQFKTLSYIDQVMALRLAHIQGADEALMRGHGDALACASSANILVKIAGRWVTPPVGDGALPGIIRGRLLRAQIIEEASISMSELERCDAACLSNALIGIRPIHRLNGRDLTIDQADITAMIANLELPNP
jgi:branched-subunit amino acid aminotransferase/4-amino-4-deoxychorismate lyase